VTSRAIARFRCVGPVVFPRPSSPAQARGTPSLASIALSTRELPHGFHLAQHGGDTTPIHGLLAGQTWTYLRPRRVSSPGLFKIVNTLFRYDNARKVDDVGERVTLREYPDQRDIGTVATGLPAGGKRLALQVLVQNNSCSWSLRARHVPGRLMTRRSYRPRGS